MAQHLSVAARQRQTRTHRMVRHTCFKYNREVTFRVRKSLVDIVDEELENMETAVFYQRVFILAKNKPKQQFQQTPPPKEDLISLLSATAISETKVQSQDMKHPSESKGRKKISEKDVEVVLATETFFSHDVEKKPKSETLVAPTIVPSVESFPDPTDSYGLFKEKLKELQLKCLRKVFTMDQLSGLFLYMNDYTMLMLEGSEDMIGFFLDELSNCSAEFWESDRIFQVEDHVKSLYTKEFIMRRIGAAYINEKFPTSTPNDEFLMGKQHLIIKDKLISICRKISESLLPVVLDLVTDDSDSIDTDEEGDTAGKNTGIGEPVAMHFTEILPSDVYRKLLPEIQRIDLVLAADRFYSTLKEFTVVYGNVPFSRDDDSLYWPIDNNYTPTNVFTHGPFDINLTFSDYAAEMMLKNRTKSLITFVDPDVEDDDDAEAKPVEK